MLTGSRFGPGATSWPGARPRTATPAPRHLRLAVFALLLLLGGSARAGTFIFADEGNGVGIVTHPQPYTGTGGDLTVTLCIDPTSANASTMEVPLQNVVNTWNELAPTTGNLLLGGANDIPSGQLDFESTLLHEVGHCIGLGHPNLASESGLPESQQDFTKSTDGNNDSFDVDDGADDVPGSSDDLRGDDVNLHWFQTSDNDPFTLAVTVDSTTYSRDLGDLPTGHSFAANGDRDVGVLLGFPNTEAVMQQGTYFDEDQRRLTADDVATLRYGMSGVDESEGTSDDYTLTLSYAGLATDCDVVIDFDDTQVSLAACFVGGTYISHPDHVRITTAEIFLNTGFSWFFNDDLTFCGNGTLDETEDCDDGNTDPGDCCSPTCEFEPDTTECRPDAGDCDVADFCDGAGACDPDAFEPPGTACGDQGDTDCDNPNTCDAGGVCLDNYEPVSTECRPDAGDCDVADFCDGAGACDPDAFEPPGTACGDQGDTDCDNPNTCDAGGVCLDNYEPVSTECRPDAGECDVADFCDGAGACAADGFEPLYTRCGNPKQGDCDAMDFCDGAGTCIGMLRPEGYVCRASAGECDVAETCDGSGYHCAPDAFKPAGTACGDPGDTPCDGADSCDGAGICLDNVIPAGGSCDDGNDCTENDQCDVAGGTCSGDLLPQGASCNDGDICTQNDQCDGGGICSGDVIEKCGVQMPTTSVWGQLLLIALLTAAGGLLVARRSRPPRAHAGGERVGWARAR